MTVRAKFVCSSVRHFNDPVKFPDAAREYTFTAQYDMSTPEDRRFQKYTPWGEFKMNVDNPAVYAQFEIGKAYYIDLTAVPID